MTFQYKPGLGNAASFQVAGTPWVKGGIDASSTPQVVRFPSVTQWVVVSNDSAAGTECKIGFSQEGVVESNYLTLEGKQTSPRLEVKVTELWLNGGNPVSVMAGLSGIDTVQIDNLTLSPGGTNWSGSAAALVNEQ